MVLKRIGSQEIDHFAFYKVIEVCFFLWDESVSQPVSDKRELIEKILVAPVTIRAASFRIFSRSFTSYCVQLSHTTSAYSKRGRRKEKYII